MSHITVTPAAGTWVARANGAIIAETGKALILQEGSYAPVVYFPRDDAAMAMLDPTDRTSVCPWKGQASYFSIVTPDGRMENVVWSYETPKADVAAIAGHLAFYPAVTVEQA
jgi:uncharacterized protein (DUF427 family)